MRVRNEKHSTRVCMTLLWSSGFTAKRYAIDLFFYIVCPDLFFILYHLFSRYLCVCRCSTILFKHCDYYFCRKKEAIFNFDSSCHTLHFPFGLTNAANEIVFEMAHWVESMVKSFVQNRMHVKTNDIKNRSDDEREKMSAEIFGGINNNNDDNKRWQAEEARSNSWMHSFFMHYVISKSDYTLTHTHTREKKERRRNAWATLK